MCALIEILFRTNNVKLAFNVSVMRDTSALILARVTLQRLLTKLSVVRWSKLVGQGSNHGEKAIKFLRTHYDLPTSFKRKNNLNF